MNIQYGSLTKIPNQQGFLVLNEDGAVIISQGDVENDEKLAGVAIKLATCLKGQLEAIKRLVVVFPGHHYIISGTNKKLIVIKRLSDDSGTTLV